MRPDTDKKKVVWKMTQIAGLAFSIPFEIAAGPFIGYFIGALLRDKLGVHFSIVYILITLGFIASIVNTVIIIKAMIDINKSP